MSKPKSFTEKTSADDTSIGFDYQYYYFLYRLLNLKTGESVGLEVKDDVHTELQNDFQLLFQLKHTVQKTASGTVIALAELDSDLWKTLHNWAKIICDPIDGRLPSAAQLTFVKKTEFHLVTNKSESKSNEFLKLIEQFRRGEIKFAVVKQHVQGLLTKSQDKTIQEYISAVLALTDDILEEFSRRIFVELGEDDVIELVKRAIHEKVIDESKLDSVFARLDSNLRSDNFIAIKKGERIVIKYEEFFTRYRHVFTDARSNELSLPVFKPVLPDDIFAQVFIKRLLEISDLALGDTESAIDYTIQKMRISRYFEQWVQSGELVVDEVDALHKEVILRWTNEFRGAFKKCTTLQEVVDEALVILKELRRHRFKVSVSELSLDLSHGELYHLSDESKIGWHRDWEKM
ncbi:hypothetical protein SAMN04515618_11424 [Collimonas sp. OK307]|uniref:ABC-three component system protein n=1 Tax=Collimonas sp. OK307 TaxID=1801620 RepID=UPI0008E0E708|nr:ABC-three component system protein [Collimonas sp. OK307]SFI22303.1 hypothetical protein SAMN04515618_11424 [Collimonas sp. OK307]